MERKFKSTWSGTVLTITTLTLFILAAVIFALVQSYIQTQEINYLLLAVFLAIVPIVTLFYMPLYIKITDTKLCCRFIHKTLKLDFSEITNVETFEFKGSLRMFGSGGFLGNLGWFRKPIVGKYLAYATSPKDAFIVYLTNGKKIVFSANERDEIIDLIREKIAE